MRHLSSPSIREKATSQEVFGLFIRNIGYVAFQPRDKLISGYLSDFKEHAGCLGNLIGNPIIYLTWGISLILTAPFKNIRKKDSIIN